MIISACWFQNLLNSNFKKTPIREKKIFPESSENIEEKIQKETKFRADFRLVDENNGTQITKCHSECIQKQ
jgi:hypothetical protein